MVWLSCCQCKSNEEKITELDFSRCGISEVPNDVYVNSPTLEVLHLEGNKLKDLSPQLFQCIDLRYLNVNDNEIRAIPPLISKMCNLQVLIFSKNALFLDGVHSNLDKLSKLTVLDLSMNDLGKVPDCILSLINLQQLCLNDTGIDFVPANIGRLTNLRVLELRDNNLCELPKSIRRLANLQRLDVSDNNLTNLTEVCESHSNLTELWINGNNIMQLPICITHLKKVNDFDASYNNLEQLPKEIGHWTKITNLILNFNNLTSLPKAIGNLRNLQVLKMESNYLEELPNTISKLINLEELNLQNNSLSTIPSEIGHLRKLATLILSDNKLKHLPAEIGSCSALSILNIHNNQLKRLPEEVGHLQNLTTLGLIGNQLSYLPITISKLSNLKALWLTPNQTQPLIHLQNERLTDGQIVLTSVVFPQVPIKENAPIIQPSASNQTCHITFNTTEHIENDVTDVSLNRTPTPHYKELKRLREILHSNQLPESQVPSISEIKEAKVTHISAGDLNVSQYSLNDDSSSSVRETNRTPQKQPPPYHIAAVYSKNAHLFAQLSPPSPHDQPKQFSQQQPANIHMPTPKLANYRNNQLLIVNDLDNNLIGTNFTQIDERVLGQVHRADDSQGKHVKWPFGHHQVYQVIEIDLPESRTREDFQIAVNNDSIFVSHVSVNGAAYQKLFIEDKILSFDEIDFSLMDVSEAYRNACDRMGTVKNITVSRRQTT